MARRKKDQRAEKTRAELVEESRQLWLKILIPIAERGRRNRMAAQSTKVRGPGENNYWQKCDDGKWWYFMNDERLRIATIWEAHLINSAHEKPMAYCVRCEEQQPHIPLGHLYAGFVDCGEGWSSCEVCGTHSRPATDLAATDSRIGTEGEHARDHQVESIRRLVGEEEIEQLVNERKAGTSVAKWCRYCRTLLDYIDGITTKTVNIPRGFASNRFMAEQHAEDSIQPVKEHEVTDWRMDYCEKCEVKQRHIYIGMQGTHKHWYACEICATARTPGPATIFIPFGFYTDRDAPRRIAERKKKRAESDIAEQLTRRAIEISATTNIDVTTALRMLRQCMDIAQEYGLRGLVP